MEMDNERGDNAATAAPTALKLLPGHRHSTRVLWSPGAGDGAVIRPRQRRPAEKDILFDDILGGISDRRLRFLPAAQAIRPCMRLGGVRARDVRLIHGALPTPVPTHQTDRHRLAVHRLSAYRARRHRR